MKEKEKPRTAVFLDEFLPFHPDNLLSGEPYTVTADTYYPMLNNFFNLLEKKLNCKVIIAAHPRSNYDKRPDYFEGRERIKGKTPELVRDCVVAIAHCSTSLNFACLFYKPVIFLTTMEMDKDWTGKRIHHMAKLFGKKPIYMDKIEMTKGG